MLAAGGNFDLGGLPAPLSHPFATGMEAGVGYSHVDSLGMPAFMLPGMLGILGPQHPPRLRGFGPPLPTPLHPSTRGMPRGVCARGLLMCRAGRGVLWTLHSSRNTDCGVRGRVLDTTCLFRTGPLLRWLFGPCSVRLQPVCAGCSCRDAETLRP